MVNQIKMADSRQTNGTDENWIKSTSLFTRWVAMKEQILLHKWYESEKAGRDIGWDKAAANWKIHHESGFMAAQSDSSES